VEAALKTSFTFDTLAILVRRCPGVHFVWIMGADNLPEFHRWRNWRRIAALMPIAVVDRGGTPLRAFAAQAPSALARWRLPEAAAPWLATQKPPAWLYLHGLRLTVSSTRLREKIGRSTR
jgi:nicotinate-nucleotide adenylyltransferase